MDNTTSSHVHVLKDVIHTLIDCRDAYRESVEKLECSKDYFARLLVETIQTPEDMETTSLLVLQLGDLIADIKRLEGMAATGEYEATSLGLLANKLITAN